MFEVAGSQSYSEFVEVQHAFAHVGVDSGGFEYEEACDSGIRAEDRGEGVADSCGLATVVGQAARCLRGVFGRQ